MSSNTKFSTAVRSRFAVLAAICFISISGMYGCGIFDSKGKQKSKVDIYFVQGNPRQLYSESVLNETSFFETKNLDKFSNFNLYGVSVFLEQREIDQRKNSEDGRDTPSEDVSNDIASFQFSKIDGLYRYQDSQKNDSSNVQMGFIDREGLLEATSLKIEDKSYGIQIVHYSVMPDNDAFSLLGTGENAQGRYVIALYFTKNWKNNSSLSDVAKKYHYLLGPGVRARWSNDLNINICGSAAVKNEKIIKTSLSAWSTKTPVHSDQVKIGTLNISTSIPDEIRPFSDMNQVCIWVVHDFNFFAHEMSGSSGKATVIINKSSREIVAGNIFIAQNVSVLEQTPKDVADFHTKSLIIHELGHLLGLGHEFTKEETDDGYKYQSIMGYHNQGSSGAPTEHDRRAIRALYID